MTKIVLKNPYFEEEIKVKESMKQIKGCLDNLDYGNISFMQLQQIEPTETIITINPKKYKQNQDLQYVITAVRARLFAFASWVEPAVVTQAWAT